MKKYALQVLIAVTFLSASSLITAFAMANEPSFIVAGTKMDIKIKNDTDDEVSVINAGSGGTYRLSKNVVTTIKMEDGDKLHLYVKGKKDRLLLTASSEIEGKIQLLSKL
jgi:hypothetical protein